MLNSRVLMYFENDGWTAISGTSEPRFIVRVLFVSSAKRSTKFPIDTARGVKSKMSSAQRARFSIFPEISS